MKRNQGTRNFSMGRRRAVKKDDMHTDTIEVIILLYKLGRTQHSCNGLINFQQYGFSPQSFSPGRPFLNPVEVILKLTSSRNQNQENAKVPLVTAPLCLLAFHI